MKIKFAFPDYLISRSLYQRHLRVLSRQTVSMATRQLNGALKPFEENGIEDKQTGVTLKDLPKSCVFTTYLPPDPDFSTAQKSFKSSREDLGPRMVKGALYTYVRPDGLENPELLAVGRRALEDIGLLESEERTKDFTDLVAGNKILWDPETMEGIYPWAQCYGGMNTVSDI